MKAAFTPQYESVLYLLDVSIYHAGENRQPDIDLGSERSLKHLPSESNCKALKGYKGGLSATVNGPHKQHVIAWTMEQSVTSDDDTA